MVRESSAQTTPLKSPNNNGNNNNGSIIGKINSIISPTSTKRTDESFVKSEQSFATTDQSLTQEKHGMHKSELPQNGLQNVARKCFQLNNKMDQELPSTTEQTAHNSIAPNPPPPPPPLLPGNYDNDGQMLSVTKECCRSVLVILLYNNVILVHGTCIKLHYIDA